MLSLLPSLFLLLKPSVIYFIHTQTLITLLGQILLLVLKTRKFTVFFVKQLKLGYILIKILKAVLNYILYFRSLIGDEFCRIGRMVAKVLYQQKMMKFRRCTIDHCEIKEIMNIGHFEKLAELRDDNSTLEVELPNIFTNEHPRKSVQQASSTNYNAHEEQIDGSMIRSRSKKKAICVGEVESRHQKTGQSHISYYMLIKMLFPEGPGIPALSIDVMDTIFYNSDGSMTYVYTDPKRGLIKTKSKNYIDLFLKRKAEIDSVIQPCLPVKLIKRSIICGQQPYISSFETNDFMKNYDYMALLRYKDEHFIRLKQHEFKSIFIRPVQANQKYKIWNNTQYLQLIPEEVNYREGTILNIQFCLKKHRDTSFFLKAVQKHSEETASRTDKESKTIKDEIKKINASAYLLYIVFEIYAYVHLHYQKQISSGVFEFMKVKDEYYLSNVRNIKVSESDSIRNSYARSDLFEDFINFNQSREHVEDEHTGSGVVSALEDLFDRENVIICEKVKAIIQKKISDVENRQDASDSNYIFKSINGQCEQTLHDLFQNESEYEKFLLKKEIEIDGSSPIVSISNIKRKRIKQQKPNTNSMKLGQTQNKQKLKQNIFNERNTVIGNSTSKRAATAKWYKKTMSGRKQYLVQPKRD